MVVSARTQMSRRNACLPCLQANDFYADDDSSKKKCLKRQKSTEKVETNLAIHDKVEEIKNIVLKESTIATFYENNVDNKLNDALKRHSFTFPTEMISRSKFMRPPYPPPPVYPLSIEQPNQTTAPLSNILPSSTSGSDIMLSSSNSTDENTNITTITTSLSNTSSEYDLVVKSRGIMGQFFR